MTKKILHILSQRPGRTGSGVTLEAFVRGTAKIGWQQNVIVGTPADENQPAIGELPSNAIHPLVFEQGDLEFPLPGMSDVMPYRSSVFSKMSAAEIGAYRKAWTEHIGTVIHKFQPDLIHSHHIWIVSSLIKQIAPDVPLVTSCHATGIRQMELCPNLRDDVVRGCREIDRFFVLHGGHAQQLSELLEIPTERIHVVGAGFNEQIFHSRDRLDVNESKFEIAYAGKYSHAKGLPALLDCVELLSPDFPDLRLNVAGSGSGPQADRLRERMQNMMPTVQLYGQVSQNELAELLRRCSLFVLPSFYEGLPLVVVEALACGCAAICTNLGGVRNQMSDLIGQGLELVELPKLKTIDQPEESEIPAFVNRLRSSIHRHLVSDVPAVEFQTLQPFTWSGVFEKVAKVWFQVTTHDG